MTTSPLALLPIAPSPIAAEVTACLGRFDDLILDLDTHEKYGSSSKAMSDALGRFKIWSGNIGAHRTGQRSLDHRLRDASHLQEQVLRLLTGLGISLGDAREISSGARVPWDELQLSDSDTDDDDDHDDDDDDDDDDSENGEDSGTTSSTLSQDVQFKTEMDQIMAGVDEALVNLLRLSATIRNPARHDQYLNFSKSFDTTPFEQFDIGHVMAKYPGISRHLSSRLGTALSRRRCYFKYREGHRNKLAAGLIVEDKNDESTVASSLPDRQKVSAPGVSILNDDDNQSDGGFTATSFATSLADTTALRIPPLPTNASYEKHFECPFCYNIVMVNNRATWKKHVYSDLQPYMCLWEGCPLGRRMMSTRHEWLQHEQDYHGKIWACCLGCPDSFEDRHTMQDHYATKHTAQTETQMDKVIQASKTQKFDSGKYTCPLCSTKTSSAKSYARHAGRHLRELALFALPAYPTEEEIEDDESENESENESGNEFEDGLENGLDNESTKEIGVADQPSESILGANDLTDLDVEWDGPKAAESRVETERQGSAYGNGSSSDSSSPGEGHRLQLRRKIEEASRLDREEAVNERRRIIPEHSAKTEHVDQEAVEEHQNAVDRHDKIIREARDILLAGYEAGKGTEENGESILFQFQNEEEKSKQEEDEYNKFLIQQKQKEQEEVEGKVKEDEDLELIRRNMELKYNKDRQQRAEEEARIKAEEDQSKRHDDQDNVELEEEMRKRLESFGFHENQIEAMIKPERAENLPEGQPPASSLPVTHQPTFAKVHRKYLDTDTLHFYDIPYEFDSDPDYIIIMREMEPKETEILFEHTRRLRSRGSHPFVEEPSEGSKKPEVNDYKWVRRRRSSRGEGADRRKRVTGIKEMFF